MLSHHKTLTVLSFASLFVCLLILFFICLLSDALSKFHHSKFLKLFLIPYASERVPPIKILPLPLVLNSLKFYTLNLN